MSIIQKGERVIVQITAPSGRVRAIQLPASYGILHDPDGQTFAKCSVYLAPTKRTSQREAMKGAARAYFGHDYDGRRIKILGRLPAAESFRAIGPAVQIDYIRRGKYAGAWYHPFKLGKHPILSKSGRWYRLDLGGGCIYNDRGFVFP